MSNSNQNVEQSAIVRLFLEPESILDYGPAQLSKIIVILRHQKSLARFAYRLEEAGILEKLDTKARRHFKSAMQIADKQKEQVFNEAKLLSKSLSASAGYLIFLKGAAYSMAEGRLGRGRIYSDIDVLVPKGDIPAIEQQLALEGWIGQVITDYDDKYYRKWAHEIPPLVHGQRGTIIDVHHNIVPVISKSSPDIELLASHRVELLPGIFVLTLPAQLLHCAIHLFRNEEYRESFRDLCDVYLMAENQKDSFFNEALALAQKTGFEDELLLALKYSHEILNLILPVTILHAIEQNKACNRYWNKKIFQNVLLPMHSLLDQQTSSFYLNLASMRGHLLKMPLHILIYHLTVKSCRGILEAIFGAHLFTPDDPNPAINQQVQDTSK